jgi:hypothetical protein
MEWRYEPETKTIRSVPQNHWIATMDTFDGAENHETNAHLIAAAPELYAALKALADLDDGDEKFAWKHEVEFNGARAALAKADAQ